MCWADGPLHQINPCILYVTFHLYKHIWTLTFCCPKSGTTSCKPVKLVIRCTFYGLELPKHMYKGRKYQGICALFSTCRVANERMFVNTNLALHTGQSFRIESFTHRKQYIISVFIVNRRIILTIFWRHMSNLPSASHLSLQFIWNGQKHSFLTNVDWTSYCVPVIRLSIWEQWN